MVIPAGSSGKTFRPFLDGRFSGPSLSVSVLPNLTSSEPPHDCRGRRNPRARRRQFRHRYLSPCRPFLYLSQTQPVFWLQGIWLTFLCRLVTRRGNESTRIAPPNTSHQRNRSVPNPVYPPKGVLPRLCRESKSRH